jgi:transcriptional regulator
MHPNPVFHTADAQANLKFARDRGFGVLAVNGAEAPLLSHVPFLVSQDGRTADLHLVRSNPIARALDAPLAARIAVSGADGYISPDWYGVPDQVPTWNYVAVHLTGQLERLPDEALLDLLDRQSALFETRLAPKAPWTTGKMDAEALRKMMRMIVPCRMVIEDIQGTWKMSQNKPDDVRLAAAEQMEATGFGAEVPALARAMREV